MKQNHLKKLQKKLPKYTTKREILRLLEERKKQLKKTQLQHKSLKKQSHKIMKQFKSKNSNKEKKFRIYFEKIEQLNDLKLTLTFLNSKKKNKLEQKKLTKKAIEEMKTRLKKLNEKNIKQNIEELQKMKKQLNHQSKEESKILKEEIDSLDQLFKKNKKLKSVLRSEIRSLRDVSREKKKEFKIIETKKLKLIEKYGNSKSNIFELEDKADVLLESLKRENNRVQELEKMRGFSGNQLKSSKELSQKDQNNYGAWVSKLMNDHPHLLLLRERLRPCLKVKSFSLLTNTRQYQSPNLLPKDAVSQLIMQHYEFQGKPKIRKFIEFTTGTKYRPIKVNQSPVIALLLLALRDGNLISDFINYQKKDKHSDRKIETNNLKESERTLPIEAESIISDTSIWDEPQDNPNNIVFNDQNDQNSQNKNSYLRIESINQNKIIEHLIPDHEITVQRYEVPEPKTPFANKEEEEQFKNKKKIIVKNVLFVLEAWVKQSFSDLSPQLIKMIITFLKNQVSIKFRKFSTLLLNQINILEKSPFKIFKKNSKKNNTKKKIPSLVLPKNIFSQNLKLSDISESEFARQLTLIRFQKFRSISPLTLTTQSWQKERLKHKAKNLLLMIHEFNQLSNYITHKIVSPVTIKQRIKQLIRFIKMGQEFLNIHNFDGLMIIIAGLRDSSVNRLKHTQREIPVQYQKTYEELLQITDSLQNYSKLKRAIQNAPKPCLPHIGMYLTDITLISDSTPDKLNGLINFSKLRSLHKVIFPLEMCKQVQYNFFPIWQIQQLFNSIKSYNSKKLYQISLKNEPRNVSRSEIK
ncbi:guanine nucleotide exchange factor [Anaeramoeba flamelloides]|uniref:Guanine nucleotide exchange factor n=1 Tax=Anaeramoeba flamelloides TaxID=1746091 RepID=A0ABQ8YAX1_9EUKA|nr:guanine nucleotide exchange factor [Anaeramoeba flamelloides]